MTTHQQLEASVALERAKDTPLAPTHVTPMSILQLAIGQNADIDKLTKLMELQERWEANEARKAFNDALAVFKQNPPTITKNKHVKFNTSKGVTEYDHATLDHVCAQITKGLGEVGIAHKWKPSQDGARISVTCILTHRLGHSEETTLSAMPDDSGGKNVIQQLGSTVSYLERYTLMAATGMASGMPDTDGHTLGKKAVTEMDSKEFARYLELIENAQGLPILDTTYQAACADAGEDSAAKTQFKAAAGKRFRELSGQ